MHLNTNLLRAERARGKKRVWFQHGGAEKFAEASEIIYALGRVSQLQGLNLDRAGVALAKRGHIACNARQQTSVPHIFGAGDVVGPHEIVHLRNPAGRNRRAQCRQDYCGEVPEPMEEIDYRLKLFVIFSEPQVAFVGMTEKELRRDGIAHEVACYPFNDHGKSMLMDEVDGFVKLDRGGKIARDSGGRGRRAARRGLDPRNRRGHVFSRHGWRPRERPALPSHLERNLDLSRRGTGRRLNFFGRDDIHPLQITGLDV